LQFWPGLNLDLIQYSFHVVIGGFQCHDGHGVCFEVFHQIHQIGARAPGCEQLELGETGVRQTDNSTTHRLCSLLSDIQRAQGAQFGSIAAIALTTR
jgi:hypothetical protein